jgi:hypothetical protein
MAFRHRGGDNLTVIIHAEVQFLPPLSLLLTVFLGMPFALTTNLQAATVNDQGYRSLRGSIELSPDRYGGVASRQCCVIRTGKGQIHQRQDRAKKPFGLAQGQVEQPSQPEGGLDGEIGIDRLGTSPPSLCRRPCVDGVVTDPEGDVAAITQ